MPNGNPTGSEADFRLWVVEHVTQIEGNVKALASLPARVVALEQAQATDTGRWAMLKPLLPWLVAAFVGLGGFKLATQPPATPPVTAPSTAATP